MENELTFTFWAVMSLAVVTAIGHTLAGPDHYLPFIALSKSRKWSMSKTMMWSFLCGVGHIVSAVALAFLFYFGSRWLPESHREFIDEHRGDIAAWLLVAVGAAYALWGGFAVWRERPHKHVHTHEGGEEHAHTHRHSCAGHRHWHERPQTAALLPWIIFIIFAFGPCEALWPLLLVAASVGTTCLMLAVFLFSATTILTMMLAVWLGVKGMRFVKVPFLERYSHVIAGLVILACGLAILFLGL